ncbi:MAG TPA: rhodanese-like domain-containing protein [Verrucomicrobiota bacterium]|nr:rhodanese-like domain-containing protein [Verrucomicrobiota bacterium]HNU49900.1 rhodanese-like domain-containing protein [Verrucomicrobiota bacterium]
MKRLMALAVAAVAAATVWASEFPEISVEDLDKAVAARKVTVIDVNGTASWKRGHIPGAIDYASNKGKLASLLPKDKNALVVAYCGSPKCGAYAAAAKAARELGYTNVKHLKAGISGWKEAGRTIEPAS